MLYELLLGIMLGAVFFIYCIFVCLLQSGGVFLHEKKCLGQFCCKSLIYFEWQVYLKFFYLVVIINLLILKCCLLGHLLIKDFSNKSELGQLMPAESA